MNNTTRTIIFFVSLMGIVMSYFFIIPSLPYAFENETRYTNYLAGSIFVIFPLCQMISRKLVLRKYKMASEDHLFDLKIHDAKLVHFITFFLVGFVLIIFPVITTDFIFSNIQPQHYLSLFAWLAFDIALIELTYKKTKAQFGKTYILIEGYDFRPDFPFGSILYSHSGVYFYTDIKYYYIDGNLIVLELEKDLGKLSFDVSQNSMPQITSYLAAQKIRALKL